MMVDSYISNAIDYCLNNLKECKSKEELICLLKAHNALIHSIFRYSIAKDVANHIFPLFKDQIKYFNLYGSTIEYNAGVYSDIDILIKGCNLKSRLSSILRKMNLILSIKYFTLLGKDKNEWKYNRLLDIHIINDTSSGENNPSRAYLEYILQNNSVPLI